MQNRHHIIVYGTRSFQLTLVLVSTSLLAASFAGAGYLQDQPLHHVPTVLALILLFWCAKRGVLSNASTLAIHAFIWLHILGARYIYSFVPYDNWCTTFFGFSLSDAFNFQRNHYDRLVHFAYGALATFPQFELLRRRLKLSILAAQIGSFTLVLAAGAVYEIIEWLLAMTAAPDWAERYNGQQGDAWDAQKDMALAAAGACVASACILIRSLFRR